MKKFIYVSALAGAISLATPTLNAETISVGIDLSGSNPLLAHENFAYSAAQYVSNAVLTLSDGDVVNIETFGATDNPANILSNTIPISRQYSPQKVAASLAQYIRGIPGQANVSQASTNLIAWLEFTSGFDCANGGRVIVITDGLESSSLVDGRAMLNGSQGLPDPEVDLTGCEITFYGLGAGWQPQSIRFVRSEWMKWSEKAGATFKAIIP